MPPNRGRKNNTIDNTTRERIIDLVTDKGMAMMKVAKNFNLPASTVRSIVNTFLETSRVTKLPRGGNRPSRIEQEHLDWLIENIDEFAGRPVQWLTNKLNENFQIQPPVTQRCVDKAINELTVYTLERMRADPERYNEPERIESQRAWAQSVFNSPDNINQFVYIDEAGFNLHITRRYGCAPRGRRALQRESCNRSPNMSLVVAVDKTGIVAHHFKRGAYNQESLTEFLEHKVIPRLENRRRTLLMDSAKFHKTQRVEDAIAAAGHTLLLLPPHSPHLNAANFVFSSVSTAVRQEMVEAETLPGHVAKCLARIDAAVARGWNRKVQQNMQLLLEGDQLRHFCSIHQAPYSEGWDDETGQEKEQDVEDGVEEKEQEQIEEEVEEEEEGERRTRATKIKKK